MPYAHKYVVMIANPYGDYAKKKLDPEKGIFRIKVDPIFFHSFLAATKESFFEKHVVSRGAYALWALVAVIADIADLAIGSPAAAFSIFPFFGRIPELNDFAMRQLTALAVIDDVCRGLRATLNPQQLYNLALHVISTAIKF